jgi:hypothetical protein
VTVRALRPRANAGEIGAEDDESLRASALATHPIATGRASGNLFFDAVNQRLVYTRNPGQAQPTAVEQIILLPGVTRFDPAWIIRR